MALQLIDLTTEVEYIDVDASKVPYSFSIKLKDKTFVFTIKYNEEGGFYTVDLLDVNGNVLAFGDIIRYGRPLFNVVEDERFPIPVIIPSCLSGDEISEVTPKNFGKQVKLYLHDRQVE
ncbi:MAG: hypothetical protein J6N51_10735 [Selenomonas sp.]|nr:hypothetical protein [Selenomonas sp.]MBP3731012.1 hypothetical protein [Mailhella sp.]